MVLLIIDTQKSLVNEALYNLDSWVQNIKTLIATARQNQIEVIYVVHDDGPGTQLTPGAEGFAVFEPFAPQPQEKVLVKTVNSAFKGTGLCEYLHQNTEKELVIAGLQTDKCVNATVIAGFEHGFKLLVPGGCNSTVDNAFMRAKESCRYYNEFLWPDRFARCLPLSDVLKAMQNAPSAPSL